MSYPFAGSGCSSVAETRHLDEDAADEVVASHVFIINTQLHVVTHVGYSHSQGLQTSTVPELHGSIWGTCHHPNEFWSCVFGLNIPD